MTFSAPPRRRWFRFSLRTFFVLLTIFCVWLGVQVKWIRDRHEALQLHDSISVDFYGGIIVEGGGSRMISHSPKAKAPWGIRIFGEAGVGTILVDPPETDYSRLTALFPEAKVIPTPKEMLFRPPSALIPASATN